MVEEKEPIFTLIHEYDDQQHTISQVLVQDAIDDIGDISLCRDYLEQEVLTNVSGIGDQDIKVKTPADGEGYKIEDNVVFELSLLKSEVEHGGICIWERVNANTTCTYQLGIRSMDIKFRDNVYYTVADHSFYAMKEDDYLSEQRYGQPLYYEAHMIDDDRVYIIDHSINESYVINCAETELEKQVEMELIPLTDFSGPDIKNNYNLMLHGDHYNIFHRGYENMINYYNLRGGELFYCKYIDYGENGYYSSIYKVPVVSMVGKTIMDSDNYHPYCIESWEITDIESGFRCHKKEYVILTNEEEIEFVKTNIENHIL